MSSVEKFNPKERFSNRAKLYAQARPSQALMPGFDVKPDKPDENLRARLHRIP